MHLQYNAVFQILLLCRSVLRECEGAATSPRGMELAIRAMFDDCDLTRDGRLDMPEMSTCIRKQAPKELADRVEPSYYFRTFDTNKNGYLDFHEFSAAVKPAENVEYDVTTRDGTKKTYTQEELAAKTLESTKGVRMQDGQLVKDDEGTSTIDELIRDNPKMARVVLIGNFARDLLNHSGTIDGRLHSLRTLSRQGVGAEEGRGAAGGDDFGQFLPDAKYFDVSLRCSRIMPIKL
jgi:Ca2+-binding EF-hand superfamily protein